MLIGAGVRACDRSWMAAEEITSRAVSVERSPDPDTSDTVHRPAAGSQLIVSSVRSMVMRLPAATILAAAASHIIPGPRRG